MPGEVDPLLALELEARVRAGVATPEERAQLQRIPITVGGPGGTIVVPRPFDNERDFEEWARAEEARLEADPTHPHRKPAEWKHTP